MCINQEIVLNRVLTELQPGVLTKRVISSYDSDGRTSEMTLHSPPPIPQELDSYLVHHTYMVGGNITLADVVLYFTTYSYLVSGHTHTRQTYASMHTQVHTHAHKHTHTNTSGHSHTRQTYANVHAHSHA